jgi:hypothetical protein
MRQGKLEKARNCKLFYRAPIGYVRISSEEIVLDPDPRVQALVRLIFAKFVELGSCRKLLNYFQENNIRIPMRRRANSDAGELHWHPVKRDNLYAMLHHPIYAGAYAHGHIRLDRKQKITGSSHNGRVLLPWERWKVLRKNALPAYITWEQYLDNLRRLSANRSVSESAKLPQESASLVEGLVICEHCNRQMQVECDAHPAPPHFFCSHDGKTMGTSRCTSVEISLIDELVSRQVLESLQPHGLRSCLEGVEKQFQTHNRLPELVLSRKQQAEDHVDDREQPAKPTYSSVWESIRALATEIATLWNAPSTTFADRQIIIRQLLKKVVIDIPENAKHMLVFLHWTSGLVSRHEIVRSPKAAANIRPHVTLELECCEACS